MKAIPSPRRVISPPTQDLHDDTAIPSKLSRGLAGRPLSKPSSNLAPAAETPAPHIPSISAAEKAELEELRADRDRSQRVIEDLRAEKSRLTTQVYELQNSNAQLIEDNTRDGLCIKAKEAQLVRARADAESAEEKVQKQVRELERLRRELSRSMRSESGLGSDGHENGGMNGSIYQDSLSNDSLSNSRSSHHHPLDHTQSAFTPSDFNNQHSNRDRDVSATGGNHRSRSYMTSPSSEKENNGDAPAMVGKRNPLQQQAPIGARASATAGGDSNTAPQGSKEDPSWKRAAEVTSQLKARIEQMKVRENL